MTTDTPVYIELAVTVSPLEPFRDLFIAQLGEVGFESFSETEEGFAAYILKDAYTASLALDRLKWDGVSVSVKEQEIEQVNWNSEWETNFDPIEVDGRVYIRAPFHAERNGFEYPMLIEPKMSFGTGHHQTTHMMIQWLLETSSENCDVLDMGCGTGILGILAGMRGAKSVHGIDVDTWCIDNTLENAERNGVPMSAALGGSEVLEDTYDLILANINLNVLLADLSHYVKALRSGGSIFFSGFYEDDVSTLRAAAEALGLNFEGVKAREQWRSIKMVK